MYLFESLLRYTSLKILMKLGSRETRVLGTPRHQLLARGLETAGDGDCEVSSGVLHSHRCTSMFMHNIRIRCLLAISSDSEISV